MLFLDEPTTGVDPQSRNHIFQQVKALNAAGVTVIYTSHYLEEVQTLCTRIAILDCGKLLACDTLPALLTRLDATIRITLDHPPEHFAGRLAALPGVKRVDAADGFTLIVENAAPVLIQVARLCAEHGIEWQSATIREPTLERVFLKLTGRELRD